MRRPTPHTPRPQQTPDPQATCNNSLRVVSPQLRARRLPPNAVCCDRLQWSSRSPVWLTGDRGLCCAPPQVDITDRRQPTNHRHAGGRRSRDASSVTCTKSPPSTDLTLNFVFPGCCRLTWPLRGIQSCGKIPCLPWANVWAEKRPSRISENEVLGSEVGIPHRLLNS